MGGGGRTTIPSDNLKVVGFFPFLKIISLNFFSDTRVRNRIYDEKGNVVNIGERKGRER